MEKTEVPWYDSIYSFPVIISAACTLHNFLIDIEKLSGDDLEMNGSDGNHACTNTEADSTAASKRDDIAHLLA